MKALLAKIRIPRTQTLLRVSAILTLLGLGFMVWSVLEPTPMPVILAMSVGQGLGIAAFAIYLFVVLRAFRRGGNTKPSSDGDVG